TRSKRDWSSDVCSSDLLVDLIGRLGPDVERNAELIDIWTEATNEVDEAMRENFDSANAIYRMVHSGARGNWMQIRQIAGMRGLQIGSASCREGGELCGR